jgi:hypothetical protein
MHAHKGGQVTQVGLIIITEAKLVLDLQRQAVGNMWQHHWVQGAERRQVHALL